MLLEKNRRELLFSMSHVKNQNKYVVCSLQPSIFVQKKIPYYMFRHSKFFNISIHRIISYPKTHQSTHVYKILQKYPKWLPALHVKIQLTKAFKEIVLCLKDFHHETIVQRISVSPPISLSKISGSKSFPQEEEMRYLSYYSIMTHQVIIVTAHSLASCWHIKSNKSVLHDKGRSSKA